MLLYNERVSLYHICNHIPECSYDTVDGIHGRPASGTRGSAEDCVEVARHEGIMLHSIWRR